MHKILQGFTSQIRPVWSQPAWISLFFAIALFVRLGIAFSPLSVNAINGDEIEYVSGANSIIEHGEYRFGNFYAFRPPGFSLLLAGLKAIGLGRIGYVHVFNALVSFLGLILFYKFLQGLQLSPRAGKISLVLYAFYPAWLGEILWLTPDVIYITIMTGYLFLLDQRKLFLAGCTAGLMTWFRPEALMVHALILAIMFLWDHKNFRKYMISGILAAVVLAPWLMRNFVVLGKPYVATNFALNLWLGNSPGANGTSAFSQQTDQDRTQFNAGLAKANDALKLSGETAYVNVLIELTKAYVREHPTEAFARLPEKVYHMWRPEIEYYPWAIAANRMPDLGNAFRNTLEILMYLSWAVLSLLAIAGFFVRSTIGRICGGAILAMSISTLVFIGEARYHLFILPFLCTLAGFGAQNFERRVSGMLIQLFRAR